MFQINSYLQYKNTPDGKPRVLREGVDYNLKTFDSLHEYTDSQRDFDTNEVILTDDKVVANLSDCRPLLSVEDKESPLLDLQDLDMLINANEGRAILYLFDGREWKETTGDVLAWAIPFYTKKSILESKNWQKNSFFDDPEEYSQLLWNCSEEEGWQKVFKLLNITL